MLGCAANIIPVPAVLGAGGDADDVHGVYLPPRVRVCVCVFFFLSAFVPRPFFEPLVFVVCFLLYLFS